LTYIYTTGYTECDPKTRNCLQKSVTINGVEGKQIQIDTLSLSMSVATDGITGTATVTVDQGDGTEKVLATWEETHTEYTPKSEDPEFLADTGKPAIIRWYLKTSDSKARARMKQISYTYTILDVVPTEPEIPVEPEEPDVECLVSITCPSEKAATLLIEALKTSGYLENETVSIYKKTL
jgi:hypothetical protein